MEEREAGGREKVKGERKGGREGERDWECVICSNNQQEGGGESREGGREGGRERGIGNVSFVVIIRTVCHHVHPYMCLHTSPHQVECILSQTDDGTVVLVSPTLFVPPPS